jgi:hypothetical protein
MLKTWDRKSDELIKEICGFFHNDLYSSYLLAIRSLACDEDGSHSAKAGKYDSVLNVKANDPKDIREVIVR